MQHRNSVFNTVPQLKTLASNDVALWRIYKVTYCPAWSSWPHLSAFSPHPAQTLVFWLDRSQLNGRCFSEIIRWLCLIKSNKSWLSLIKSFNPASSLFLTSPHSAYYLASHEKICSAAGRCKANIWSRFKDDTSLPNNVKKLQASLQIGPILRIFH